VKRLDCLQLEAGDLEDIPAIGRDCPTSSITGVPILPPTKTFFPPCDRISPASVVVVVFPFDSADRDDVALQIPRCKLDFTDDFDSSWRAWVS